LKIVPFCPASQSNQRENVVRIHNFISCLAKSIGWFILKLKYSLMHSYRIVSHPRMKAKLR